MIKEDAKFDCNHCTSLIIIKTDTATKLAKQTNLFLQQTVKVLVPKVGHFKTQFEVAIVRTFWKYPLVESENQ